jgi:septal ring factor EnvC (AmiA/AmiB activator)
MSTPEPPDQTIARLRQELAEVRSQYLDQIFTISGLERDIAQLHAQLNRLQKIQQAKQLIAAQIQAENPLQPLFAP